MWERAIGGTICRDEKNLWNQGDIINLFCSLECQIFFLDIKLNFLNKIMITYIRRVLTTSSTKPSFSWIRPLDREKTKSGPESIVGDPDPGP
jgi:hypothetical protein